MFPNSDGGTNYARISDGMSWCAYGVPMIYLLGIMSHNPYIADFNVNPEHLKVKFENFYFQKKVAPSSQSHADGDLSDDGWARRLYAEALRCREQDGEDEALEELRSLAAGMARAAASKELWRL